MGLLAATCLDMLTELGCRATLYNSSSASLSSCACPIADLRSEASEICLWQENELSFLGGLVGNGLEQWILNVPNAVTPNYKTISLLLEL